MLHPPPKRSDVLSDDVGSSCALRFAEAIEGWECSIPTIFSNPDESDITNNPAPQYESTRWARSCPTLKNQVADIVHIMGNTVVVLEEAAGATFEKVVVDQPSCRFSSSLILDAVGESLSTGGVIVFSASNEGPKELR